MQEGYDWRQIINGMEIPTSTYSDQPYVVQTDDGAWLCCVTTGVGHEGEPGQVVTTMRSLDQGKNWSNPVPVEPPDGPEASYAVMLKIPSGRVYIFYNHNTDNIREVTADHSQWYPDGICKRVDSLGYFVFKYSDDRGQTWSDQRFTIPIREMDIDRKNPYGGKIRFFWNVGKPFINLDSAYISVHKVGGFGEGFFTRSEGVLLKSTNLLTERDPEKITWETIPDGDFGLRTPAEGGSIAEEQSYVVLSDGSFYSVYRSIDGHPVCAYSRDGGHTWSQPEYQSYADGKLMKNPRAANFVWKCVNGRYLYWFHNHGGRFIREHPSRRMIAYEDRNPVWLCGGIEADSPEGRVIRWSQPEIVLYDDDPYIRMSYPDLIFEEGAYFLTETQKDKARVHRIPSLFLEDLWTQGKVQRLVTDGLVLNMNASKEPIPAKVPMPKLPTFTRRDSTRPDYGLFDRRVGFTIEVWLRLSFLEAGQVILDNRLPDGKGICLQTTKRDALEIVLNDGRTENRWACDSGMLQSGVNQHIVVVVDGGPKIISFITDGRFNDGGEDRQFGWGRFNPQYRGPLGADELLIAPNLQGELKLLRIYDRALRTSEVVMSHQLGIG